MTDEAPSFRTPIIQPDGKILAEFIPADEVVTVYRRPDGTPYIKVREA
ncbi:hypothetical protein ACMA46_11815 [Clavibacter sp. Sh2141]